MPPPDYQAPGVYAGEIPHSPHAIAAAQTSVCAFVGALPGAGAPPGAPVSLESASAFGAAFGDHSSSPLQLAVSDFFANGGGRAVVVLLPHREVDGDGTSESPRDLDDYVQAFDLLRSGDGFNLLCLPPCAAEEDVAPAVWQVALDLCVERRAMLLVDAPRHWDTLPAMPDAEALSRLGLHGMAARNAALYFPRLLAAHASSGPAHVACGAVAGMYARTDRASGVWKAPAGLAATLRGTSDLARVLSDAENGVLNPLGINCIRRFPQYGTVVWGARTLAGADHLASEYKYVPVRRTALFIEQSVCDGIGWAASHPNGEPLWASLRASVESFMHALFRQGAFQGASAQHAYFVRCDGSTHSQVDIEAGTCNIRIGFAPLKPAEFVVLHITQAVRPG